MKILVKIIAIVIIFFGGFWLGQNQAQAPADAQTAVLAPAKITVSLKIDFGSDRIETYDSISLEPTGSVYDLLKAIEKSNNIIIGVKDYGGDLGVLVEAIGGIANDSKTGTYWQYWVNDQYAKVGASTYRLKSGDKVEWKFLKSQIK